MNRPDVGLPRQLELAPPVLPAGHGEERLTSLAALLLAGLAALAIALEMPKPNYPLVLGGLIGLIALAALLFSPRLELAVGALAFFLGCLNGPLKLLSSTGHVGSAIQDVLIIATLLGLAIRHLMSRRRLTLPPLSAWVLGFVAVVVLEAFNPKTLNLLKVAAGFREQLQFVPFFVFGWLVARSKGRLRKAFLLLGVIALANGVVATYQTRLSPAQAATWGSGYKQKFTGHASKTYKSEGVGRVRPTGLGDESGASGGAGIIAIAGTLALLATSRRRKWLMVLLTFGAIAAIATGLGRIQVAGGVLAVIGYALFTTSVGGNLRRPLRYLLVALALAIPFGFIFVSVLGEGTFSRYASLFNGNPSGSASYKEDELRAIPHEAASSPLGFGLGTAGSAASFGGKNTELLEGHNVNAETTYNYLFKETGLPGVIVWLGTLLAMLSLAFRRIRLLADQELQIYLAAVFAPIFAMFFMSFEGPVSQSGMLGPFFWFALGVAAYWLEGPGFRRARRTPGPALAAIPAT